MPTFVQANDSGAGVSSTTLGLAYSSNNAAGNLLVALIRYDGVGTFTLADSQGNTWVLVGEGIDSGHYMAVYYAQNCKAGANTVTFTNTSSQFCGMIIGEWSGLNNTSTIDAITTVLNTAGNTVISAPAITTNGTDLIIGFFEQFQIVGGVPTASSGFTMRRTTTSHNNDLALMDQSTTAGTYTAAATWASTNGMGMAVAFIVSPTTPGFIQSAKSTQASSSAGATAAFPSVNTAGNTLIAICGNEVSTFSTVTDTLGNNWIGLPQQNDSNNQSRAFYCLNCKGGANTVVFNLSSGSYSFAQIGVAEFRTVNKLDVSAQTVATSTGAASVTTNHAVELIVGLMDDGNGSYSAGAGYATAVGSSIPQAGTTRLAIVYATTSSTGTYTPILSGSGTLSFNTFGFYLGTFVPMVGFSGVGI